MPTAKTTLHPADAPMAPLIRRYEPLLNASSTLNSGSSR